MSKVQELLSYSLVAHESLMAHGIISTMKKKWECSECDYNCGRHSNMVRHIHTMHYTGSPRLSVRYASKVAPRYNMTNSFFQSHRSDLIQKNQKQRAAEVFAESYCFKDPLIGILMQFNKALKLKEGFEKQMIMNDLFKQFEQVTTASGVKFPNIHSIPSGNLKVDQNSRVNQWPFTLPSGTGLPKSMINHDSNGYSDSRKPIRENERQNKLGYVLRKFSKDYQDRQKRGSSHEKLE